MRRSQFSLPKTHLFLFILLSISIFSNHAKSRNMEVDEHSVMVKVKQILSDNPTLIKSWHNSSASHCEWPGIGCSNGRVISIVLRDQNISRMLPNTICNLQNLTILDLAGNSISGMFPKFLRRCIKLESLDLSFNGFFGPIPHHIQLLSRLQYLNLGLNSFHSIPKAIGKLRNLNTLLLEKNKFNSSIPVEIGNLSNLEELRLSDYYDLAPSMIPLEFAGLKKLRIMLMSQASLIGEIPASVFSNLSNLENVDLSGNTLTGPIPEGFFRLRNLKKLILGGNHLDGELPTLIETFDLVTIDLCNNRLTGPVPLDFQKLRNLEVLLLAFNQFSGIIPSGIVNPKLKLLSFVHNHFSGKVPDEFAQELYRISFRNNSNLCTDSRILDLPKCNIQNRHKHRLPIEISVFVLSFILVLGLCVYFLGKKYYYYFKKKQPNNDVGGWQLLWFHKLNFSEVDILSRLSENNLIGSGGSGKVYGIIFNNTSSEKVAVKRISNDKKLDHRLEKEFLAEVQILGMIRHVNIIKLLCCISSKTSKLLVYEYMENMSLDMWLHKRTLESPHGVLNWPKRLQIAIGAAQGLCYMHHDCSPPIIHRDVKSSNILLDSELNAKIADFGLAKVLLKKGDPETASAVAGTFGYIAPEYAYTVKVNEKSDIYSFGVVLLELATGRHPVLPEEQMNLAEWAWRQYEELNTIVDALDDEIKEECHLETMNAVFKLGLKCTSTSPSLRPSMNEILQILLSCASHPGVIS